MSENDQNNPASRTGLIGVLKLIALIAVLLLAMLAVGLSIGVVSREAVGELAGTLLVVLGILSVTVFLIGSLIGRGKR